MEKGGQNAPEYHIVAKGAPEILLDYLGSPPQGYADVYKQYAAQGARWALNTLLSIHCGPMEVSLTEDVAVQLDRDQTAYFMCLHPYECADMYMPRASGGP